jgi:hypothetical protein
MAERAESLADSLNLQALPYTQSGVLPLPERLPMQILHPFAGSIQQYCEAILDPDRYRPDHCPQCEAQQPLAGHGFYQRTLVDVAFDGVIRVRRYLCHLCKRTVSLLPDFALNHELAIPAVMARIRKCEGRWAGYLFFAGIRPVYLQIIWTASQSESSHSSNSTSRLHRGGLSGRTEGSTFSRALRLVSRLARA